MLPTRLVFPNSLKPQGWGICVFQAIPIYR